MWIRTYYGRIQKRLGLLVALPREAGAWCRVLALVKVIKCWENLMNDIHLRMHSTDVLWIEMFAKTEKDLFNWAREVEVELVAGRQVWGRKVIMCWMIPVFSRYYILISPYFLDPSTVPFFKSPGFSFFIFLYYPQKERSFATRQSQIYSFRFTKNLTQE